MKVTVTKFLNVCVEAPSVNAPCCQYLGYQKGPYIRKADINPQRVANYVGGEGTRVLNVFIAFDIPMFNLFTKIR